ncbi:integration host factor subunit beta [bacterium]|nr:integration host factor subunit beta [candidate division CSSED10-310 bacterium]
MTKSEFIIQLANSIDYVSHKEASVIVNTFFDAIASELVSGQKVELRGFGSFKVKERSSRTGRNPKTGQTVKVPLKKVPFFKPGKELRILVDPREDNEAE